MSQFNQTDLLRRELREATYAVKRARWMYNESNRNPAYKHFKSLAWSALNKVKARLVRAIKAVQALLNEICLYRIERQLRAQHFNARIRRQLAGQLQRITNTPEGRAPRG